MKVLHIQTGMGSCGNAAFRLHLAMRYAGIDSHVHTYLPSVNRNYVTNDAKGLKTLFHNFFVNAYSAYQLSDKKPDTYLFHFLPFLKHGGMADLVRDYDVVYLHWICSNYLSAADIEDLGHTGKPIIFFMHDMWTMTAGCHHSFSCKQYEDGCKNCQMFANNKKIAKTAVLKKEMFTKYDNFYFVSPSRWMADCAKRSFVLKDKPVYNIWNIVDEKIYKSVDKIFAREILNLPKDKYIITFGALGGTGNPYKGWTYLRDAINSISLDNVELVVYGKDYDESVASQLKYPVRFLGPLFDEHILALVCNASDLFVSPSLAESFGLTLLENILCGTPVIAFDCTSIPEIVRHGENGLIAKYKDYRDLAKCIKTACLRKKNWHVKSEYTSSGVIKNHLELMNIALSNSNGKK
ncbi:MAG: glycosyltransferase [Bacteroidales bacterium]|nr:glycosyltransferase [Bacteroidales bacterium]MCM1147033.1 glycosyltransferase [Bacteroidales bacterium]MCM1205834.1 glycosyltransferase [Bacillota bacterium]MCM1509924.1 glycosyltransferase [Clostridium sp.]